MKRVLIIAYYWPPAGGSGVQRWVKFSKYLPSQGWQPVIYTPLNPEITSVDETLLADIPAEAEVIKTKIIEPYSAYRMIMGSKQSTDMKTLMTSKTAATGGEVNPINNDGKLSLKKRLSLFIRGNFFIPDPRVWWVRSSVKFLKQYLREHPVDIIVTTGPPHSMHLIGRGLAKETGIPWIPDFRDPWTKIFYYKHLHLTGWADRKHHRLEQAVLDEATAVLTVTPAVQADYQARTSTPVAMITNGFDTDDFTVDPAPHGDFNVVHTGLFAAAGNPLVFWDILAERCADDEEFRNKLRIRLSGKTDAEIIAAIQERGLGPNLVDNGYVNHEKAVMEQRSADLLLLPLRQEPEYAMILPGKLFEYLAARKTVLGIGQPDGACAKVLDETGAGVMYGWEDAQGMKDALDCAWKAFRGEATPFVPAGIDKYSRKALTVRLAELLDSVRHAE